MAPRVETRDGKIEGCEDEGVLAFRGIPFAQPPVGELRFRAPQPPEPWTGVREAKAFGYSAPQAPLAIPLPGMEVGELDEDCLTLNVFTPAADAGRRPVLVWIHGGGFVIGSSAQPLYDGAPLVRRGDVVVVTINYRLGPLGFLYLADLCPDLEGAVGNAGLRDQIAALAWVHENIERFGGDPDNVTIFGESAGGMSVGSLLGMPAAREHFHKAIPQSGATHNVHTRDTATKVAEHFLGALGVSTPDAARVLRELPPDKLLDTHRQTMLELGTTLGLLPFQPLVDDDSLRVQPLDAIRAGDAGGIPLLTGTTRDEWKLFSFLDPQIATLDEAGLRERLAPQLSDPEAMIEAYRSARSEGDASLPKEIFFAIETDRVFRIPAIRLAEAQQAHQPSTYMYRFDWVATGMGGALGACHAVELPFVFGLLDRPGAQLFTGGGPEAVHLSGIVMDAWVAFARSGDPGHEGLPGGRWSPYGPEKRATMVLGRECALELDPQSPERRAWDGIL
ncbi:MAG: carboxylesterase/lipase family protein [Myxococcota bacterium]|nr:carboxylesterase/lipase family protein [Myxococcota bacterium]